MRHGTHGSTGAPCPDGQRSKPASPVISIASRSWSPRRSAERNEASGQGAMHDLVITGGRVALDDGWADCDIGIEEGRIAAIGNGLAGRAPIAADGLWV